uniref:Uncharacterized protein n=1 Tax=Cacopsylla melanoneura TaxID=428564 RepID=A0A8D8W6Q2_9HEMI
MYMTDIPISHRWTVCPIAGSIPASLFSFLRISRLCSRMAFAFIQTTYLLHLGFYLLQILLPLTSDSLPFTYMPFRKRNNSVRISPFRPGTHSLRVRNQCS